jgi:putative transposase
LEEKEELLAISRSHKLEKRYVDRTVIILHSDEGKTLDQIIALTGKSRPVISKWRKWFHLYRIEGLKDARRSGKPKKITAEQKALVVEKASTKPEGGYTNWSQQRIANEIGISQSKVFQILKQADLKPHKIEYWCGLNRDPEFEQKIVDIVG